MPFNPPFMSLTFFSVCPLHFPCMSCSFVASHFPTSPVVPIGFLVRCFPFLPPYTPLFSFLSLACPFKFPFVSLSCPAAFLSCRLPISSPHFLALPCISPLLPNISLKKTRFSSVFESRASRFRQKEAGTPTQQRAGRGNRAWDPCSKTTFSGTSSNCRAVLGGGGGSARYILRETSGSEMLDVWLSYLKNQSIKMMMNMMVKRI